VIPARYASSRFPGKPLALIGDKPMIQWVYEAATKAAQIEEVLVATDHEAIFKKVNGFGGKAIMTASDLPSGTDRVYQAVKNEQADIIINLQGDEPFVSASLLDSLVNVFKDKSIRIATPVTLIKTQMEVSDPNIVKVVRDSNGFALYFSRAAIPYHRDNSNYNNVDYQPYFKHIGIYAYSKSCLEQLTNLAESSLEKAERLEQLRFIENGYKIFTILTDYNSISVDTPDDLEKVNQMLQEKK
jgi:3-deoxy-manno-octulosonate cytidylyltransferase (CMP-KDO synthetase)